ncbi:response regulator transcription factor [Acidisphaera sp. L21]|jgi:two-component system torCAD operon response regulator TorR|uniref:response regulator transcription factor n=1 Tax=Acidisphaera sp. L21 TaxID=1641851 RepID=UPI00131B3924|nr:response regulator transcription factor [Acidisphaera sp. L21]
MTELTQIETDGSTLTDILLIEDDPAVAESLRRAIERSGMQMSWASTGLEAMTLKRAIKPQIVLLDMSLPDTNGIVLIKWLVEQADCGVIVVSGSTEEADRVVALELGADDYVSKPPNMRELIARMRAVHRRTPMRRLPAPVSSPASTGGLHLDSHRRTVHGPDGARITLTAAEFDVLEALSLARGQVVSRHDLSTGALRRPWQPDDRSVDQLILNLRQKLHPDPDGISLIESIRGRGYLLRLTADLPGSTKSQPDRRS